METLKYIFNPTPAGEIKFFIPLLITAGILFIGSFFIPLLYRNNRALKNSIRNFPGRVRMIGIFLGIYLGCRYESIPFFSMFFFLILIGLLFLYFIIRVLYQRFKVYPKQLNVVSGKKPSQKQTTFEKYLPKPKKK
jgi:uncharacterized membrane protein YfcA